MNNRQIISQNESKFRNARLSLLSIVIFSAVNLFSVILLDTYFLFSAYIPQILAAVGASLYFETGIVAVYLIFAVIGLISIIPYLLCWIFSKKKKGWMIAALVIFSLDSLLFLVDFVSLLMQGEFSFLIDLVFHVWALVSLILGVKYGLKAKAESAGNENEELSDFIEDSNEDATEVADGGVLRTVTVTRKKSYIGCAIPMFCYVNGKEVCQLKNGETKSFEVSDKSFELGFMLKNAMCSGSIQVDAGTDALAYTAAMKAGMMANTIVITPTGEVEKV